MSSSRELTLGSGAEPPRLLTAVPGPESRAWLERARAVAAPMGPRAPAGQSPFGPEGAASAPRTIVYRAGAGANVVDVDGNRYVDLAAGFGSLLLGHRPEAVVSAVGEQSERLAQSLGDLHPSDCKIRLMERLQRRVLPEGRVILGQSGADAVSAALKTAVLHTGKPGIVAFGASYHGLSYGPLALCGLRESYRAPFRAQLNPAVRFVEYPHDGAGAASVSSALLAELERGDVGAVVIEPILGRGGCVVPPQAFFTTLRELCTRHGCLLIADEIWTGLGRSGEWLLSAARGAEADLVCLGKGLGGILPLSACVGRAEVMASWSRREEVVHTATFAGAPLACAAALATLEQIEQRQLVQRSRRLGAELTRELSLTLARLPSAGSAGLEFRVRGAGLMLAVEMGTRPGLSIELSRRLLERGYIVSLGGGGRESIVLTPPLDIAEPLLEGFVQALADALEEATRC